MADILALVAACLFALAATLQQKGALGMGAVSLGEPSSFVRLAKQTWWLLGTLASVLLVVFGEHGSPARKAAAFGACAGLLYGLSASLWKPAAEALDVDGLGGLLSNWEFWAFATAGILAFLVQQVSLATGRLAPSVAMTSVLNPLVGILIGTLLLDERLADPTWHKAVAYAGLGFALAAAVSITRSTEETKPAGSIAVDASSVATPEA